MPFPCPFLRAALAGLLLVSAATIPASEGALDTRFGSGGRSTLPAAGMSGPGRLLVRPDGRIVYAARRPDLGDVVVGALSAEGTVDAGFHGGVPLAVPTGGILYAPQLAAYATGHAFLLAVSEYSAGVYRPIVCQVRDDGTFDPGFTSGQYPGQSGCIRLDVPAATPNGVVLAGIAPAEAYGILRFAGTGYDFASSTHTTFPVTGLLLTGTGENPSSAITRESSAYANVAVNAFGLFPLGSGGVVLYLAGSHLQGGDPNIYVGRRFYAASSSYNETSYAPNLVTAGVDSAQALALDELGRVLVASSVEAGGGATACLVQRYTPTLAPDTSFGPLNNGRRYVPFGAAPGDAARCDAVVVQGGAADARVLLGGALRPSGAARSDMVVARLLGDGSFDADFGSSGYARFNSTPAGGSPGMSEQVLALGLQGDRAILAGPSEPAGGAGAAWAMFLRLTGDALFADGFD